MTKGIKEERVYFDLTVPEGDMPWWESWKQRDHYLQETEKVGQSYKL